MVFTQEEFDIMIDELLYRETVCFDMLCSITIRTTKPGIEYMCKKFDSLRGRGFEEDFLQDVCLIVMTNAVKDFFLKKRVNGDFNNDPRGFSGWLKRVAANHIIDYLRRNGSFESRLLPLDEFIIEGYSEFKEDHPEIDKVKEAFSIVIASDNGIYKVLSWLAYAIFNLDTDVNKKKTKEEVASVFENFTLFEMYEILLGSAKYIPWTVITKEENDRIVGKLNEKNKDGRSYGDIMFKDFFMRVKGERSGKKSISDWVYRLDETIQEQMDNPSGKSEKKKKAFIKPKDQKKKKPNETDKTEEQNGTFND